MLSGSGAVMMIFYIRREPGCHGGNQFSGLSLAQRSIRQRAQDAPVRLNSSGFSKNRLEVSLSR
jgi:hypothetical protein